MIYNFKEKYYEKVTIGKIVCLARTYKKHAQEMNTDVTKDPLLFLKPASSVIFNDDSIIIPKMSNCLHHEVELGVLIGKKCKNIKQEEALNYVLGYLIALDVTARDIQSEAKKNGWPWSIAKGFDTFSPISEVVLKGKVSNPNNLNITLKVNGKIKQNSNTKNMIYSVERIIKFISDIMTLEKGDLIITGTPEGVGEIVKGDVLEAELGNLCYLKVNVKC
ncbi:MAG: fumarylacetoacetate hydrolase family protein [Thermoplasmatales archaeon]|nr:fumarylacetoacetate hydrolase family protein [Thermoplasmatales archaeon]